MANFREYSTRLETAGNMRRVTSTMKMVAASHLHRAQNELHLPDPFRQALRELWPLASHLPFAAHRICSRPPRRGSRILVVIMTANRGLCGAFNHAIIREVRAWHTAQSEQQGVKPQALFVGAKAYTALHREIAAVMPPLRVPTHPTAADTAPMVQHIIEGFVNRRYDEIWLANNKFVNAMNIEPQFRRLLPLEYDRIFKATRGIERVKAITEPNDGRMIDALMRQWIHLGIYTALLHSVAGEHASRVMAMENATINLTRMGKELLLLRNRARQAAITNELSEIVSGAETLE